MESHEPPSGGENDLAQQLREAQEEVRKLKERVENAEERAKKERQLRLEEEAKTDREFKETRKWNQLTTLPSYIYYNHALNFQALKVWNSDYETIRPATPIEWRYCPLKLQPWLEFPKIHDERFSALTQLFGGERIFMSYGHLAGIQGSLISIYISEGISCGISHYLATEFVVREILNHYVQRKPCGVEKVVFEKRSDYREKYMDRVEEALRRDASDTSQKDPETGLLDANSLVEEAAPSVVIEEPEDLEQGPSLLLAVLPLDINSANVEKDILATGDEAHDHRPDQSGTGPESTRKRAAPSPSSMNDPLPVKIQARDGRVGLDTLCADHEPSKTKKILVLIEYKTPQMFKPSILRRILNKDRGTDHSIFMHCKESKMVEYFLSEDPSLLNLSEQAKEDFQADFEMVVKTLAQTFQYMIASRIPYAILTTNECTVFLHHSLSKPDALQYHFSVYQDDVMGIPFYRTNDFLPDDNVVAEAFENGTKRTPVAMLSTLVALALDYDPKNDPAVDPKFCLPLWADLPSGSQESVSDTKDGNDRGQQSQNDSSDRAEEQSDTQTSGTALHPSLPVAAEEHMDILPLPYCTHECLLGLIGDGWLDKNCPNFDRHNVRSQGLSNLVPRHPITQNQLRSLVKTQLNKIDRSGFEVLHGLRGFFGNLVKITLKHYGYTFVAKAIISYRMPMLRREIKAYCRLKSL